MADTGRGRVIGIGGIFFKSPHPGSTNEWYAKHLGIPTGPDGAHFPWREHDRPESERLTIWATFPQKTTYFDPSSAPFMINYIVDDLDALLSKLAASGVQIDPKREEYKYGRFAWIFDEEGRKIELWEPR